MNSSKLNPIVLSQLGFQVVPSKAKTVLVPSLVEKAKRHNAKGAGRPPTPPNVLRRTQLRVLAALSDVEATSVPSAITLSEIAKKAKVSPLGIQQGLGSPRTDPIKHEKAYGYASLLARGLVIYTDTDVTYSSTFGEYRYFLSPLGQRKAYELEEVLATIRKVKPNSAGVQNRTGPKADRGIKKGQKEGIKKKRQHKRTRDDVQIEPQSPTTNGES